MLTIVDPWGHKFEFNTAADGGLGGARVRLTLNLGHAGDADLRSVTRGRGGRCCPALCGAFVLGYDDADEGGDGAEQGAARGGAAAAAAPNGPPAGPGAGAPGGSCAAPAELASLGGAAAELHGCVARGVLDARLRDAFADATGPVACAAANSVWYHFLVLMTAAQIDASSALDPEFDATVRAYLSAAWSAGGAWAAASFAQCAAGGGSAGPLFDLDAWDEAQKAAAPACGLAAAAAGFAKAARARAPGAAACRRRPRPPSDAARALLRRSVGAHVGLV